MYSTHVPRDGDHDAGPNDTLGPLVLQIGIPLCVVTVLAACHRLYYVRVNRGWLGKEDYMLAFAVVCHSMY